MGKNKNEGGAPDQDTDEILKEMEDEGIPTVADDDDDAEAASKGKKDDEEEEDGEEDEEEDDEESDDDEDEEEEVDEDEDDDEEDSEDDDDAGDEDEEEEEDEDEEDDQPQGRTKRFIPLWQHKKEMKQLEKRMKRDLQKAAQNASETADDVDEDSDDVQEIVTKYGLPKDKGPEFVSALIKAATKRMSKEISVDDIKKLRKQVADQEEERQFNREMSKTEKTIRKLFPEVRSKDLARIKERVKKLAYTERYQKYSLRDIVLLNKEKLAPKDKKRTGESAGDRGATKVKASKRYDLSNPDSIPWADLSDEEFDEVSAELEKRSGSGIKVHKKNRR